MLFELAYQCFRYLCSCLEANNGATLVKTFLENNTKKSKVIKRWHTRELWSLMKTSLPIKILTLGSFFPPAFPRLFVLRRILCVAASLGM